MTQERLYKVLLGPLVSEKSSMVADKYRQIVFKVMRDANKREIKAAVEALFEVKVERVSSSNMKGKVKRFRQREGCRKDWKKAFVTLQEGYDIDFATTE